MKLEEWFINTSRWTKGEYFRDNHGIVVPLEHMDSEEICSACLSGALRKCYPDMIKQAEVRSILMDRIKTEYGQWNMVYFNDSVATFKDIQKIIKGY